MCWNLKFLGFGSWIKFQVWSLVILHGFCNVTWVFSKAQDLRPTLISLMTGSRIYWFVSQYINKGFTCIFMILQIFWRIFIGSGYGVKPKILGSAVEPNPISLDLTMELDLIALGLVSEPEPISLGWAAEPDPILGSGIGA